MSASSTAGHKIERTFVVRLAHDTGKHFRSFPNHVLYRKTKDVIRTHPRSVERLLSEHRTSDNALHVLVGVTFVIVVLMAMVIGLLAAIYYSWGAPLIARQRLRRQLRKAAQEPTTPMTPDCTSPYADSEKGLESPDPEDDPWEIPASIKSFSEEKADLDAPLTPPAPVHFFPKRFRFSTATQDGKEAVWWFV